MRYSTPNATEIYVDSAKNATISCNVEGNPPPEITWNKDGLSLAEAERRLSEDGKRPGFARHWQISDGGKTLTIVNVDDEMLQGVYACSAENKLGEVGLHATGMVKKAGPRLRDPALWLPLAAGAGSRNLGPSFRPSLYSYVERHQRHDAGARPRHRVDRGPHHPGRRHRGSQVLSQEVEADQGQDLPERRGGHEEG